MNNITIFSDSTCDLNEELVKKFDIKIIPLYVTFNDKFYKDGVDITPSELYKKVDEYKKLPKTSATSVGDYIEAFKKEIDKGNDIILFTISSFFSSTYQNALIAKEEFDPNRIEIIDSLNLSTSIGLLVLKACKYRNEGKNIHEIKQEIEKIIPNVRCKFAIESLEYLHKGGRCSAVSRLVGTLLQLKPVIIVKNGKMDVDAKTRGKRKALDYMLNDIIENKDKVDLDYIMVTHTYADEEAKELQSKLKEVFKTDNIVINNAGCVVSSHCGKGTIGILYIIK
jgi:DegV family protein with EDD domain